MSDEDELPLHEMASSVGLNNTESSLFLEEFLVFSILFTFDELFWPFKVESIFVADEVEFGMARDTPSWNLLSPASICILLGV